MPDSFGFDDAGFTQDYDSTIESIVFAQGKFGFQATVTNRYDEPELGSDGQLRTERKEFISVGANDQWQAIDNGAAFRHVTGEDFTLKGKSKVKVNSQWARFCQRMAELVGGDTLRQRGSSPERAAFEAKTFEGFHLHWGTEGAGEAYELKDRDTGEVKKGKTKGYQLPDTVLDGAGSNGHSAEFSLEALGLTAEEIEALKNGLEGLDLSTAGKFQTAVLNLAPSLSSGSYKAVTDALGPKTCAELQYALTGVM